MGPCDRPRSNGWRSRQSRRAAVALWLLLLAGSARGQEVAGGESGDGEESGGGDVLANYVGCFVNRSPDRIDGHEPRFLL